MSDKPGERLVLGHEPKACVMHDDEPCSVVASRELCHWRADVTGTEIPCGQPFAAHYAPAEAPPACPSCLHPSHVGRGCGECRCAHVLPLNTTHETPLNQIGNPGEGPHWEGTALQEFMLKQRSPGRHEFPPDAPAERQALAPVDTHTGCPDCGHTSHMDDCWNELCVCHRPATPPPLPPCKLGHAARVQETGDRKHYWVTCSIDSGACWSGPVRSTDALASAAWREVMG